MKDSVKKWLEETVLVILKEYDINGEDAPESFSDLLSMLTGDREATFTSGQGWYYSTYADIYLRPRWSEEAFILETGLDIGTENFYDLAQDWEIDAAYPYLMEVGQRLFESKNA